MSASTSVIARAVSAGSRASTGTSGVDDDIVLLHVHGEGLGHVGAAHALAFEALCDRAPRLDRHVVCADVGVAGRVRLAGGEVVLPPVPRADEERRSFVVEPHLTGAVGDDAREDPSDTEWSALVRAAVPDGEEAVGDPEHA